MVSKRGRGRPLGTPVKQITRDRTRASELMTRLSNFAMGKLATPMEPAQVTAALGVLRKLVPDLAAVELSGEMTQNLAIVSAEPLTADQWAATYGGAGTHTVN